MSVPDTTRPGGSLPTTDRLPYEKGSSTTRTTDGLYVACCPCGWATAGVASSRQAETQRLAHLALAEAVARLALIWSGRTGTAG